MRRRRYGISYGASLGLVVGTSALVIALCLSATIRFLVGSADSRRMDQLRFSRLTSHFEMLQREVEERGLGEDGEDIPDLKKAVEVQLARLEDIGRGYDLTSIRNAYQAYLASAGRQYQAVQRHDFKLARKIDVEQTDVAFQKVESATQLIETYAGREAQYWSRLAQLAISVSILFGAGLVAALVLRYYRRLEGWFDSEARQRAMASSERRFRTLVQSSADVIAVAGPKGELRLISEAGRRLWGEKARLDEPFSVFEGIHPEDEPGMRQLFLEARTNDSTEAETEVRMLDATGTYRTFKLHMRDLLHDPDVEGIVLTYHDLTERKRFEEELRHHAFHDQLTGLPNRWLFTDRLQHRLSVGKAEADNGVAETIGVIFIDLDNFKTINDSLGHAAGDVLLVKVAERIKAQLAPCDTLARFGGDEFILLLDKSTSDTEATALARRIQQCLEIPISLGVREVFVTASMGIALSAEGPANPDALLRDADIAMYRAKSQGKAGCAVFNSAMTARIVERLDLETSLRTALDQSQFHLHFQPIVDAENGEAISLEVLLRWEHPTRGNVAPGSFIPVAEETSFICQIGDWVLREACAQLRAHQRENPDVPIRRLSINVSARQLSQTGFVERLATILADAGIAAEHLELEITESAMLEDLDQMRRVIEEIHQLGVRLAIDDFGTGYSSMAYLGWLPVDTVKIDRSFVSSLGKDPRILGVVRAMIAMGDALGLEVIAEGVETEDQLAALRELGCRNIQGYLYAIPQPLESCTPYLRSLTRTPVLTGERSEVTGLRS